MLPVNREKILPPVILPHPTDHADLSAQSGSVAGKVRGGSAKAGAIRKEIPQPVPHSYDLFAHLDTSFLIIPATC
jgi:hypothetical protein